MTTFFRLAFFIAISSWFAGYAQDRASVDSNSGITGNLMELPTRRYNPYIATTASMLLPGSGQLYTGRYIKAGTFLALEGITLSVAYFWNQRYTSREALYKNYMDTLQTNRILLDLMSNPLDSAKLYNNVAMYASLTALAEYNKLEARNRSYNALALAAGGYLFNVLDAYQSSNPFKGTETKDPRLAGFLAAVPCLGLGQLYNGAISKAGFVFMTQSAMAVAAYNNHQLMRAAESEFDALNDPTSEQHSLKNQYSIEWEFRQRNAFRSRNMYLWYSIFFYFYSIFDAVVDAHLHDYPNKIDIKPDLVPKGDGVSLGVSLKF